MMRGARSDSRHPQFNKLRRFASQLHLIMYRDYNISKFTNFDQAENPYKGWVMGLFY